MNLQNERLLSDHDQSNDLLRGMQAVRVWGTLGWHDIRQRYRRSVLGPFWFTLSTAILVAVLGALYSTLLNQDPRLYVPFLAIGLVVWQFISTCATEGCNVFINAGYLIKQIRLPLTVHVCRQVWRNFVIFLHSLPVVIIALIAFGQWPNENILVLPFGLILLILNVTWITVVLGILCARFRDILPIVSNFIQIAFFFTPVMWSVDILKERAWVADYNPLYHLIEIIRAPVLGEPTQMNSWAWATGLAIFGFVLAQWMMLRYRNRVAYWL
jgi:ABC-type polysaccharide/polyol phosphate export permease